MYGVNKRCAICASRIKVKNRADETKIRDVVVETCTRDRRDLIGEAKIKIKMKPRLRAEAVAETE